MSYAWLVLPNTTLLFERPWAVPGRALPGLFLMLIFWPESWPLSSSYWFCWLISYFTRLSTYVNFFILKGSASALDISSYFLVCSTCCCFNLSLCSFMWFFGLIPLFYNCPLYPASGFKMSWIESLLWCGYFLIMAYLNFDTILIIKKIFKFLLCNFLLIFVNF